MILWFGGNIIEVGGMQVGELTGFLSYVLQILNSLMMLSGVFLLLIRSIASAKRIEEVLDEPRDENSALCTHARIQSGSIDFEHVYFKYSEDALEYVLSDINLHIESGQTIGIMGGTGAAKSTLVQLIPRLYDTSKGTLTDDRSKPMICMNCVIRSAWSYKTTRYSAARSGKTCAGATHMRHKKSWNGLAALPVPMNLSNRSRMAMMKIWDRAA